MKKISLFLSLFTLTTFAQTSIPKYSELEIRIQEVDSFVSQVLPAIKTSLIKEIKEIEEFKDQKLVNQDETQKSSYVETIEQLKSEIESAENSLSNASAKISMVALNKVIKEKEAYAEAKKKLEAMERASGNSNKLKKYYSLLKARKYTLAKLEFYILNAHEKELAQTYESTNNFLVRELNHQEYLQGEIKRLKEVVIKSLSYPENAIAKIILAEASKQTVMNQFSAFKKNIEGSNQFDYLLPSTWSMGLFSCEEGKKPKYLRFKNYPNLIALDNEGNYNAVIELSNSEPKKLQMVYHCNNLGSFGVCLENKAKKLCRLDSVCAESLDAMEGSFDRNIFFTKFQTAFVTYILKTKKTEMQDVLKFNLIAELAKLGRLGYYTSKNELYNLFDPMIEKIKTIESKTPEAFYKKLKPEILSLEKQEKARLQTLPGFVATSTKGVYTLQALSYVIATIDTELGKITETESIQEYAYKTCENSNDQQEFCQNYTAFLNKAKLFTQVEEIQNIVPEECPRVVFRFLN